jgi:hypothetical protein
METDVVAKWRTRNKAENKMCIESHVVASEVYRGERRVNRARIRMGECLTMDEGWGEMWSSNERGAGVHNRRGFPVKKTTKRK